MLQDRYRVKDREPVSRRVYRNLREAIISGDLEPNTRIVEGEFAKQMGVSRTPLREALSRLETDGLVALTPGAGYSICDTQKQLVEIFHLRKALEGYAARLSAEVASPELVALLRKNIRTLKKVDRSDIDERAKLNEEFHDLVMQACPSEKVRERVAELREFTFGPSEMDLHPNQSVINAFNDDHVKLADAFEANDGTKAEAVLRGHLERALELLVLSRENKKMESKEEK